MKLVTLALVLGLAAPAHADKTVAQLTADRIAAIQKLLDYEKVALKAGQGFKTTEDIYRWSVRLVDAQLDDASHATPVKQVLVDHAKRMAALDDDTQARAKSSMVSLADTFETEFFRAEADLWVARGYK